jgi:hypothetical protein
MVPGSRRRLCAPRRSFQANAKAEVVTGNAAQLVGAPALFICKASGEEGTRRRG